MQRFRYDPLTAFSSGWIREAWKPAASLTRTGKHYRIYVYGKFVDGSHRVPAANLCAQVDARSPGNRKAIARME